MAPDLLQLVYEELQGLKKTVADLSSEVKIMLDRGSARMENIERDIQALKDEHNTLCGSETGRQIVSVLTRQHGERKGFEILDEVLKNFVKHEKWSSSVKESILKQVVQWVLVGIGVIFSGGVIFTLLKLMSEIEKIKGGMP